MEQAEEIKKMIESAADGYWLPLVIVSTAFSIIILLLIYIWNQMLKQNEKRHKEHEKHNEKQDVLLERVTDNLQKLEMLFTEMRTEHKLSRK